MKKIDLGQAIGILANVGVIAGIVFLGVELRQTQQAIAAQAYQSRAFQSDEHHKWMIDRPELEMLYRDSLSDEFDPSSLTSEDLYMLQRMYASLRSDVDNEYYQFRNGFLDEGFYLESTRRDIKTFVPIWRSLGINDLSADFADEADRIIANPSITKLNITSSLEESRQPGQ